MPKCGGEARDWSKCDGARAGGTIYGKFGMVGSADVGAVSAVATRLDCWRRDDRGLKPTATNRGVATRLGVAVGVGMVKVMVGAAGGTTNATFWALAGSAVATRLGSLGAWGPRVETHGYQSWGRYTTEDERGAAGG